MKWFLSLFQRKKNRVYERMTKVQCLGWTVRVWSSVPGFQMGPDPEIRQFVSRWDGQNPELIATGLCRCYPCIAAVEVLDAAGNGGLIYPDWK